MVTKVSSECLALQARLIDFANPPAPGGWPVKPRSAGPRDRAAEHPRIARPRAPRPAGTYHRSPSSGEPSPGALELGWAAAAGPRSRPRASRAADQALRFDLGKAGGRSTKLRVGSSLEIAHAARATPSATLTIALARPAQVGLVGRCQDRLVEPADRVEQEAAAPGVELARDVVQKEQRQLVFAPPPEGRPRPGSIRAACAAARPAIRTGGRRRRPRAARRRRGAGRGWSSRGRCRAAAPMRSVSRSSGPSAFARS